MKNTMKKKVVAGVVTFGLVSGMGMALANTDAGTVLGEWYKKQFTSAGKDIQTQVTNYATGKVPAAVAEYNGLKTDATTDINTTRDDETDASKTAIENAKQSHINSLKAKEAEIAGYMQQRFDNISTFANSLLDTEGEKALDWAEKDLDKHATEKGREAVGTVKGDLESARNQAKTDLETEIARAKGDLQAKLNVEKDATIEELKGAIDNKIIELRGTITDRKDALVLAQQKLIEEEANRQELAAKTELDALVSTINN